MMYRSVQAEAITLLPGEILTIMQGVSWNAQ